MSPRHRIGYQPARVLIVDDERHNRQLLEVMLRPEGFLLLTAASGEEALAILAAQKVDLILLDVMMPGMDGHEVTARIKRDPATRNIPVIIVTALDDHDARLMALTAGAEEFLSKPVDRAELCVRVKNLLRLKAYGDYLDDYSHMLESEVATRTDELVERTRQAAVLAEQAALLDLAQDAIVVRDMRGQILFWSRGAEVLYGWSGDEALGQHATELYEAGLAEPNEPVEVTLLRNGQWEGEVVHHRRDGTCVTVASRWTLQRDVDGAPVRILTINNDITDRRRAEEAQEQLRAGQMRFKDEFLSHVSHELRSPLTAIKQFTEILAGGLAGEMSAQQVEYQQIVLKNVRQLQSMIDDLLEVTRLETGKLTVEPERVSVPDAVADTFDTLQETARVRGVTLSRELDPTLPSAHADPTRLRQILINLLDNAIKFTPAGGAVTVRARPMRNDARFLTIEVTDTGCGISADIAGRIFERLYQVAGQIDSCRKGLGLGLYICRELVARQGGHIWFKGRRGRGSTFGFTLPVFSLADVIMPLLKTNEWPTEEVALVLVEVRMLDPWTSKEARGEWSREARAVVARCLLPDLDVLLPTESGGAQDERFFIAAFADDHGASVLANRIRDQFERQPRLLTQRRAVSVSHEVLPGCPPDREGTVEHVVSCMTARLEAAIQSHRIREGATHGE